MRILILLLVANCYFLTTHAQKIELENGGFEGQHQDATVPVGWFPCQLGSTPDILPGIWGVYTQPSQGKSYMGLITREDGSWESVGQLLEKPLKANECHRFSVDLAHSDTYSGYNFPLRIKIWGSTDRCGKQQLLGTSPLIDHTEWKTYRFQFTAKSNINYIVIEAAFVEGVYLEYRGNVLVDNLTGFYPCQRALLEQSKSLGTNKPRGTIEPGIDNLLTL